MTKLTWLRVDQYDLTPEDLILAHLAGVDLNDAEALFWWLNPQGVNHQVMTRPLAEEYWLDKSGPTVVEPTTGISERNT